MSRGQRGHQWIPRMGRPGEAVHEKDRGPALLCALEGGVQGGGYVVGSCAFDRLHVPSISHRSRRVWRKVDTTIDLSMGGVEATRKYRPSGACSCLSAGGSRSTDSTRRRSHTCIEIQR